MKDKNFKPRKNFNKEKNQKPKTVEVVTYEKSFGDANLSVMVDALRELHPVIDQEIFKYKCSEPKDMLVDAVDYYRNNVPNIVTRDNLICTLNISANKVTLRTNKFFTIGWSYKFDENGFTTDLLATITVVKREKNNVNLDKMIELLDESWTVVEQPKRK